jgi:protein phosphatase 1 regulatory subunit 7
MKTYLTLIAIGLSFNSFSQNVRIPDPNFKQRIIALGYDTNDDGQIQVSEAQKVTNLYVNNLGIVNLEGINSFVNLEEFGCYNNKITTLDVSKLKNLKHLFAGRNRITNINLAGLTELEDLYVEGNLFITALDVSKCKNLKKLYFSDNRITALDVTGLNELEIIEGENNRLEKVELRKAPKLKSVNLKKNPITPTIDIRGLTNLEYIDFSECNLLFINFSGTVNLKEYHW